MLCFRVTEEGSQAGSVEPDAHAAAVILSPLPRDRFVNPSDRNIREIGLPGTFRRTSSVRTSATGQISGKDNPRQAASYAMEPTWHAGPSPIIT